MITPLFAHPNAPRKIRVVNPSSFAFRAEITIPTLDAPNLKAKALHYAWRNNIKISIKSPVIARMSVRWLLEEGSNLSLLKEQVKESREAKYTLTRRTLHNIAAKYPELAGSVNALITEKYNPAKRSPICIPDGWEAHKARLSAQIGREPDKFQMLTEILDLRTDYKRLVGDNHRDANHPSPKPRLSHKDRMTIKAKCYKAIGYCFPELFTVAMAEARRLAPQTVKTYNQTQNKF